MYKKIFLVLIFFALPCLGRDNAEYINTEFWKNFGDDYLNCYISRALENNHDLKKAGLKVEEYRQKVRVSLGKELPALMTAPAYLGAQVPKIDNFELDTNAFILPFLANYEADFLLKNRDKTRSEKKNYEAEQFYEKTVYIALVTDIASAYINLIKLDRLIELQQKILKNNYALYDKTKLRYDNGISSLTDLNNAKKDLTDTKNELVEYDSDRQNLLYELAVMIGESPDCTDNFLRGRFDEFAKNYSPPDSISSDVIYARPDVRQCEKKLEKAKIDIRIAKKEFLPRFNITGVWIFNTISPGSFFSWESSIASIMAAAVTDLFAGGRKIANLRIKKAVYEQLFEEYKQTDLTALKEVNGSLYMLKNDKIRYLNSKEKTEYENSNLKLVNLRFKEGTASQMDILENQNRLYEVQKSLINKRAVYLIDIITLYKAAGAKI